MFEGSEQLKELLDVSRLAAGRLDLQLEDVDLVAVGEDRVDATALVLVDIAPKVEPEGVQKIGPGSAVQLVGPGEKAAKK